MTTFLCPFMTLMAFMASVDLEKEPVSGIFSIISRIISCNQLRLYAERRAFESRRGGHKRIAIFTR